MLLKMGIKGKFEDYQQNLIVESRDNNREIHDLSAYVFIDDLYNIHHEFYYDENNQIQIDQYYKTKNEQYPNTPYDQLENNQSDTWSPESLLYFKNIDPPRYYIWNEENNDYYNHQWQPEDGLFLIIGETYEYIISLATIDFTTNEPPNPKIFNRSISYSTGRSNITNTPIIKDHVYIWKFNKWIDIGSDPTKFYYTSIYKYQTLPNSSFPIGFGGVLNIDFFYPGKKEITNANIKNKLSDRQFNEIINKCISLNYTDSVNFLNGKINGPFSNPLLYQSNQIKIDYITNDYRGTTNYEKNNKIQPGKINHPDNLHIVNFTTCSANISDSNIGDYEVQFECLQHNLPINKHIQIFLKQFLDWRMHYYNYHNVNEYIDLKQEEGN